LLPLFGLILSAATLLYGALLAGLFVVGIGTWLVFGPGPRRTRAFYRAQRLLHNGKWQEGLAILQTLQSGRLSATWQGRLRNAEGECHHATAEALLREKNYEECLSRFQTAAGLLNLDVAELRARVIETMLGDVRQQFAACKSAVDNQAVQQLIVRILRLQSLCHEATFWQGLCHVREGNVDAAAIALTASHEEGGKRFLDPPLYLGVLRLRAGQTQEGLRFLGEANRIDAHCPLVPLELGIGLVAANGDSGLASRALQRAVGSRGLSPWVQSPEKLWVEAFPEGRSYVRRLASKQSFSCPVFGSDVAALVRQGEHALAQAEYRQGNFQEAANRYEKLLHDAPPSAPLVRGLGLSLARLERYDQAYKHLRAALDMEEVKDPLTAGYLALCGARGKPIRAEDKVKNVEWAIDLLARFSIRDHPELARVNSAVFAEARALGLSPSVEDQMRLCEVLVSVNAADPEAAAAYAQLSAISPNAIRAEYAWLYCRAAQAHGFCSDQDLVLFGRTFRDEPSARAFYDERQWDLEEVAYTYLERCAVQRPGRFPEELGPDFPARGEELLLARSQKLEAARQPDAALAAADVLHKLAPQSIRAHDRLAELHHQRGDFARAAELLLAWQALAPADPSPAIKRAIVEQRRGNDAGRSEAICHALQLSHGKTRAAIAFLGARLALSANGHADNGAAGPLHEARELLQLCCQEDREHVQALGCLAALRSTLGDRVGLAEQAALLDRPDVQAPRFQYLAAVCHLAAGDYAKSLEAGRRALALADAELAVEIEYVMGCAHLHAGDASAAAAAFFKTARAPESPSADHARAALARLCFLQGDYENAVRWWQEIDARRRADWKLEEPLCQTVLLAGLTAHQDGRHEQAAERFREAGRLGMRDRQLGASLVLSLIKAGQQLLYAKEPV
jgi:tetratricopeptide (TPR) repeat protein